MRNKRTKTIRKASLLEIPDEKEPQSSSAEAPTEDEQHFDPRVVLLYGQIDEEKSRDIIKQFLFYDYLPPLMDVATNKIIDEEPIKVMLNTQGGNISDMFGIYDYMNILKKKMVVETCGFGIVMSAGLPLLSNGTKGSRSIMRNTRIMTHDINGVVGGSFSAITNEYQEFKKCQSQYIESLVATSNLTFDEMEKILLGGKDVYLGPEQILEYGFVDFIEE